jgi:hypothetical protein
LVQLNDYRREIPSPGVSLNQVQLPAGKIERGLHLLHHIHAEVVRDFTEHVPMEQVFAQQPNLL